ncbi:response regulator [Agromyces sp. SYSU T00194]|uniref:response regulator n=1 Tax=Agromyces chitinivorans TaxID=3158560 RepID=UPI003392DFE5
MAGLRVIVADDDVLLREGLVGILSRSGMDVIGQVGDAEELLRLVRADQPDVAVIDIRMPPHLAEDGLDAALQIRRELPEVSLLLLSAHIEVDHALELLDGGRGVGYLLKHRITDVSDFLESLDRVADGGSVIDPALIQELVSVKRRENPLAALSSREREVLVLMTEGLSNAGIGRRLWITEGTVEKHVRSILLKLDLRDTADDHRRVRAVIRYLDAIA